MSLNKSIKARLLRLLFGTAALVAPFTSSGAELGGLEQTAKGIGYTTGAAGTRIPVIVGNVIAAFLAMIGLVFMVLIVIGGYHILNAGGKEEDFKKGKDEIRNGIIGMVVIFAAYAITTFIMKRVAGIEGGLMIGG